MRALFKTMACPACIVAAWIAVSPAQSATCPPEVASARAMLTARGGEALASSRSQDAQAPRKQSVQAARSQEVQAPRSQDVQAPRDRGAQTSPSHDTPGGSSNAARSARTLVREAELACQSGDTAQAREKALAALEVMKQ
jgi:hypothetical protein